MFKNILLSFIPIFVAVDAVGVLPIFASLTEGLEKNERIKIIPQSMFTVTCLAVCFIFLGKAVFNVLGITVSDFMIAGGAILFCIAVIDIINPIKKCRIPSDDLGAVPLGTPLIVDPAVLTTSLIYCILIRHLCYFYIRLIECVSCRLDFQFFRYINKVFGRCWFKSTFDNYTLFIGCNRYDDTKKKSKK